jgi:mannitol-1-phosphate/altronate dehydrogenase
VLDRLLHAPAHPEAVLDAPCDERIRLVTLTVTGGGYHVDPATGTFDVEAPDVVGDLAGAERPATLAAYVVEALSRRRSAGTARAPRSSSSPVCAIPRSARGSTST